MKKYIYGTPNLLECEGRLWKTASHETDATEDENNNATESLWSHLEKDYRVGSDSWDDCFLRGTFLDERSQVLEIVYPPVINAQLMAHLRQWLSEGRNEWRIIIPTFLSHRDAFVVYPDVLRYGDHCDEAAEAFFKPVAEKMFALPTYEHAHDRAKDEGLLK